MFCRRMSRLVTGHRRSIALCAVAALVSVAPPTASAAFPGSNGRIVFAAASEETDSFDLYTVLADGAELVNLTGSPGVQEVEPDWSPDGTKLAYMGLSDTGESAIYVLDTMTQQVAQVSTGWYDAYPAWSPDGNRLIWWRWLDDQGYSLWVANMDGSNGHELISGYRTLGPSPAQWSVVGLIGFSVAVPERKDPGGDQFDIFVTTPAGVGPRALTRTRSVDEQFEDWSPDGRAMTITRYDASGLGQVWLASSDGPFIRNLLSDPVVWNGSAVFSPDSKRLAFITSGPDGEQNLAVMNTDGTGRTIVATPGLQPAGLSWQPLR